MDSKTSLNTIYTLQSLAKEEDESEHEDGEQKWTKHTIAKEFINIGSTIEVPVDGLFENQPRYYVNMPRIPTIINHASIIESQNMVENLAQPSLDEIVKFINFESSTQVASTQGSHSLLSLPHLFVRRTNGREPLMDYFQSHVVTLEEYLRIMQQKAMDKEVVKQIRKSRRKEKKVKKVLTMLVVVEKLVERELVK
jgi:hypothetical protein